MSGLCDKTLKRLRVVESISTIQSFSLKTASSRKGLLFPDYQNGRDTKQNIFVLLTKYSEYLTFLNYYRKIG